MPIRADILTQLADVLAKLYYDRGSIQTMAATAGLNLALIAFYPKAIDTWVPLLQEAEVHGQTQVILDRARTEKPIYEPLRLACQAYVDWVIAGRSMAQPVYAPRGSLRAPPPPDTFAGRTAELQKLTEVLLRSQNAAISAAVPGMGGVGKTTLALKLASNLAPHFPGGVVWLESGYGAGQSDLVDRLARTLGIDLANEPLVEKRAIILKSVLANRGRVFVILDDLWDIDLGRWVGKELLPADRVWLVTSRDQALCRALCNHVQRLDVLPEPEALELLTNLLGPLGRHAETAKELVELLDGHPLALEIAAKRCDNGADDLPWVVRKLHAGPTLGALKLPGQERRDTSVEASLALSYSDLAPDLQQRFRSLGVFAPASFDLDALTAVWNTNLTGRGRGLIDRVRAALAPLRSTETQPNPENIARQLIQRGLLALDVSSIDENPVYRLHTLLLAYAWALLEQVSELETTATRHRTFYQALPGRQATNWQVAEIFWEQIEQGWQYAWRAGPDTALDYYYATRVFLERRSRHAAHLEWVSALLRLPASQIPDKDRAATLNNMAMVYQATGQPTQALALFEQALPIMRKMGNRAGEATTLNNMGLVYQATGQSTQALALFEQALPIMREVGNRASEAATLNNMAGVYQTAGKLGQALALIEQALPIMREVGNRAGEATTLNNMAGVYQTAGKLGQALALFEQALPIMREVGNRAGEAATLHNIGTVYNTLGENQQALAYFEQALHFSRQVRNRAGEAMTLNSMAMVYQVAGQSVQAMALFEQALLISRQVGDRAGEAATLNNVAMVYQTTGQPTQALALFEQALLIMRQVGNRAGEAATLNNIGGVYDDLNKKQLALSYYEQALPLRRQVGNLWGESITRYSIAMVCRSLNRLAEAEAQLVEVVALDEAIGHPDLESNRAILQEVRAARRTQAAGS